MVLLDNGLVDGSRVVDCPIGAANARNSPLLRLPAELRNKIFKEAIGNNCISIVQERRPMGSTHNVVKNYGPPDHFQDKYPTLGESSAYYHIPLVCRQVYNETALLPYSLNIFSFKSAGLRRHVLPEEVGIQKWLDGRLPVQISAITALLVSDKFAHMRLLHRELKFHSTFANLRIVYIRTFEIISYSHIPFHDAQLLDWCFRVDGMVVKGNEEEGESASGPGFKIELMNRDYVKRVYDMM